MNHTYRSVRPDGPDVVVRLPIDPRDANTFPVEAWAARKAEGIGIPTARPIACGEHTGVPFLVSEFVEADPRPIRDPWRWLGEYAHMVGSIDLVDAPPTLYSRFGPDLSGAWEQHVRYNLTSLEGDDPLRRDGAYSSSAPIRQQLEALLCGEFEFGLAHGDLAPRNLLSRGSEDPPVLIDWGAATTGPSPWTDARRVFEWAIIDRTIAVADYERFAARAGLIGDERTVASMTVLHLLDVTRWAREWRPDLYAEYARRCRRGLERISAL